MSRPLSEILENTEQFDMQREEFRFLLQVQNKCREGKEKEGAREWIKLCEIPEFKATFSLSEEPNNKSEEFHFRVRRELLPEPRNWNNSQSEIVMLFHQQKCEDQHLQAQLSKVWRWKRRHVWNFG